MTTGHTAFLALLTGLALCAAGCGKGGDQQSDVAGDVTYDGQPVGAGAVSFEPSTPTASPGTFTIHDGKFAAAAGASLKPGKYLVRVTAPDLSKMKSGTTDDPHAQVQFVPLLPEAWNVQSKLTVELKPGRNDVHFRGKRGEAPQAEVGSR